MTMAPPRDPLGRREFPWRTLRAIVGGESPIDVPGLNLESLGDAEEFLESYGFSWASAAQRAEIEAIRVEALAFLEEELLADDPAHRVPPSLRAQADVRKVLLWASQKPGPSQQAWACALLRVMHAAAHARSAMNERYGREIRSQILRPFAAHVHRTAAGLQLGTGPYAIPLADFEVKAAKRLRSVVMKLLHRVEDLAADVFDRIGVRFVTRERFDALLVVRYLRTRSLIMFANVIPTRSRNTLLDLDWVRREVERREAEVRAGAITPAEALDRLREAAREQPYPRTETRPQNPFSSIDYHAMQFTCRRQIRIAEPGWPRSSRRGRTASEGRSEELRFFFPYEVQILDRRSFEVSRTGLASHEEYKRRKLRAVRERVLGPLLSDAQG